MKWIEFIGLRTGYRANAQRAGEVFQSLKSELSESQGPQMQVFEEFLSSGYELCCLLFWSIAGGRPDKSQMGKEVLRSVSSLGVTEHRIWIEQEREEE
jgi:hypothetical protein